MFKEHKQPMNFEMDDQDPFNLATQKIAQKLPSGKIPMMVAKATEFKSVPGATQDSVCFLCKEKVWISPNSKPLMDQAKVEPVCNDCIITEVGGREKMLDLMAASILRQAEHGKTGPLIRTLEMIQFQNQASKTQA